MLNRPIRFSVISDIHLGHRRNSAQAIIKNLNAHFSNDKHISKLDVIFLAGDVFDDLLKHNSDDVPFIDAWVAKFLRLCHKYKVIVRVLEGTPSHDRAQSQTFITINEIHERNSGSHIDLKWVRELSIEHIDAFDIDVLYVPDEWRHSTQETLDEVHALMAEKELVQVDFSIMHGMFNYQMPSNIKNLPKHDEHAYMALTRHLIFIGHVHTHTRFESIIAQGSFDRLAMGEEGPKGFVTAVVQPNGDNEVTFIENVNACRFVTIDCSLEDVEENIKRIDAVAQDLPGGSFVRLKSGYGNPILSNMTALKARWPTLVWTDPKVDEKDDTQTIVMSANDDLYVPITIDRHNLKDLVLPRLNKLGLSDRVLARCAEKLSEMQQL